MHGKTWVRLRLKGCKGVVMKMAAYLGLPEPFETLNDSLESRLSASRKYMHNTQAETYACNSPGRVLEPMGPLKTGIVVELTVAGQAKHPLEPNHGAFGGVSRSPPSSHNTP
jgi:hypothetical protein